MKVAFFFLSLSLLFILSSCGPPEAIFSNRPEVESFYPANNSQNVARDVRIIGEFYPNDTQAYFELFYRDTEGRKIQVWCQQFREIKTWYVKYYWIPYQYLLPNTTYFIILDLRSYSLSGSRICQYQFQTGG